MHPHDPLHHGANAFIPPLLPIRRSGSSGFTLIELLVLVAIMAALAYIAIPIYAHSIDAAKIARAIAEI
jgi:type II secretory pathway pseudopilin PulG